MINKVQSSFLAFARDKKCKVQSFLAAALFLTFFLILYTFPQNVSAHVLKSDGTIGAVLHIDPEDDPFAGQPTNFFLEFKDLGNTFKLTDCDCVVNIYQSGKQIYATQLTAIDQNNLNSAGFSFTFPQKDVYQLKIFGRPNIYNQFKNFTLVYVIRVARESGGSEATNQSSSNWFSTHIPHLIAGLLVGVFLIFALIKQRSSKT